MTFTSHKYF